MTTQLRADFERIVLDCLAGLREISDLVIAAAAGSNPAHLPDGQLVPA